MKAGYREIECTVSAKSSLFLWAPENAIVISKNPRYNTIVVAIVDMVF